MANTIQTKVNQNAVATAPKKTMQDYIKALEPEIKKALPSVITPERFTRMVLSAISVNPKLAACDPKTFLGSMMTAAQLGLEPNTPLGQAYLIPFKNHGKDEVQFQLGYKGLIDLAYRSGEVELIQAHIVYANDEFSYEFGLEPKLHHVPTPDADKGPMTHAYAMFKTKAGGFGFDVMSRAEIESFAKKYSQSYSSSYSPWQTNFEQMALKTVLKRTLKYAPLKSDFVRGMAQDETIKADLSDDMFSVADTTIWEGEYTEKETDDGAEAANNAE